VPGIKIFRSLTLTSWVLPIVVTVIIFKWTLQPNYGGFNVILSEYLGLSARYWLGSQQWALATLIFMHVWRNAPFFAIALLAGIQTIPESLYEAAKMDGANMFERFFYVTLPNLSYISMIMIVLHVIWTFNNFDMVYLSTGGGPVRATEVLPTFAYKQAFQEYAMGYGASIGVVMMLLMAIFTIVYITLEDTE